MKQRRGSYPRAGVALKIAENVAEQMTLVITNSERGSSNVQIERAIGTRGLWGTRY